MRYDTILYMITSSFAQILFIASIDINIEYWRAHFVHDTWKQVFMEYYRYSYSCGNRLLKLSSTPVD